MWLVYKQTHGNLDKMNEGFINFSKLNLTEAASTNAVSQRSADNAKVSGQSQVDKTDGSRAKQGFQMAAKTGSPTQATNIQKNVAERLQSIQDEKEALKLYETTRSDWRRDIKEEMGIDDGEPNHPYVKVMPHMQYKQLEAEKELRAAAGKKEKVAEAYKKFPRAKVQDKAAIKPDTARGEKQARKMDIARTAHTDKRTKEDAKAAVKEREQDNRKAGLERLIKKTPSHKNKAYELEGQRRRDLDKRAKRTSKKHPKSED